MRRLCWLVVGLTLAGVPSAVAQSNCITINGITRCTAPWQIYDGSARQVSVPVLDLTQVWNNPATTFTGLKLNVTDTNSATGSLLLDLQAGGVSKFSVTKGGAVTVGGAFTPTGVILAPNGTAAAPAYTFASETGSGLYRVGAGDVSLNVLGVSRVEAGASTTDLKAPDGGGYLKVGAGTVFVNSSILQFGSAGSADTLVTRNSAGSVLLSAAPATAPSEWQVSGGNGGFMSSVKALTELTTIAAAATTATAIQIPANAVVLGVSVRVVTIIPTAATFTVTSATPAKTWNTAAVAVAAGTTDPGTAPGPSFQTTASPITITPNLTPGTATGQVRVTIYYYAITPPSS